MNDPHQARRLEKALADDERTHELGVHVVATPQRILAQGEVASEERRQNVLDVLREHAPDVPVTDQLTVSADAVSPPVSHEGIQGRE
ncbi:MAG TPA: hypothetical protein VFK41_03750 [Nocardioidaceae bacterium]|nr:hypothetical protein [Nocardioidaceae bacterium]